MSTKSKQVAKLLITKDFKYLEDIFQFCLQRIKNLNCLVLLITHTNAAEFDLLPLIKELKIGRHMLKKLIFVYANGIDNITQKLLELHNWTYLPELIIIDLVPFISGNNNCHHKNIVNSRNEMKSIEQDNNGRDDDDDNDDELFRKICLCIATLYNYLDGLLYTKKIKKTLCAAHNDTDNADADSDDENVGKSNRNIDEVADDVAAFGADYADEQYLSIVTLKEDARLLTREKLQTIINLYFNKSNAFGMWNELLEDTSITN